LLTPDVLDVELAGHFTEAGREVIEKYQPPPVAVHFVRQVRAAAAAGFGLCD
jgi:hypothetical protein